MPAKNTEARLKKLEAEVIELRAQLTHSDRLQRQSEAIMHFTDRFFTLLGQGEPREKIGRSDSYSYLFWSLQATEFYFFHSGLLPEFMYTLWMIDLANLYAEVGEIRQSHITYLQSYAFNYPEMITFYGELDAIANAHPTEVGRNMAISALVSTWAKQSP